MAYNLDMQRGAAEEDETMFQNLSDVSTVQLKQMIRKNEYELDMLPRLGEGSAYAERCRVTFQDTLDALCKELGTREEC